MGAGILVVDDEATLARTVQRYLERDGFEARVAGTLREGWSAFESFRPDVLLLDLALPDGNGLEMLAKVRATDRQVKVIILTGHGSVQTAVEAMKAGAWDYLTKPVALGELKLLVDKGSARTGWRRRSTTIAGAMRGRAGSTPSWARARRSAR